MNYVPSTYWRDTLDAQFDESAVGYPELSRSLNQARYVAERANVARALKSVGTGVPQRVLDIGSGVGVWIKFWEQRGATEITGVDLTERAVATLSSRFPQHHFSQADIGDPDLSLPVADAVSAMSVLLHITDEERFARAIGTVAASVAPGGTLVLVEPIVVRQWWGHRFGPEANSKARPLEAYRSALEKAGMEIVSLSPASCLLTNVIDTRHRSTFRILQKYWQALSLVVGRRERVGRLVGGGLLAFDWVLTRVVRNGPSVKILVARRPSQ